MKNKLIHCTLLLLLFTYAAIAQTKSLKNTNNDRILFAHDDLKIEVKEERGRHPFWSTFRYNKDVVLPQYHIPDYGKNHLKFLLSMDPILNRNRKTFNWIDRLNKDFIKNHNFELDSIGSYNGRTAYFITIKTTLDIFKDMEVLETSNCRIKGTGYIYFPKFKGRVGYRKFALGKLVITADDLAIVYLDYNNGNYNDRYKFVSEYVKIEGLYYPSKIYFGNKFWMSSSPNFTIIGDNATNGFWCEDGKSYYNNHLERIKKQIGNTKNGRNFIKNTIANNTININLNAYPGTAATKNERAEIIGRSKIIEQLRDTLDFKKHTKYLHHRMLRLSRVSINRSSGSEIIRIQSYTDFDKLFYYLGDPYFPWYFNYIWMITTSSNPKDRILTPGKYMQRFPYPITSDDEKKYIIPWIPQPKMFDNYKIVKGLVLTEF